MTQEELIWEEQKELDDLIKAMDQVMLELNKRMTYASLQEKKAREKSLPDTYGALVDAQNTKASVRQTKRMLSQTRDELYHTRLILAGNDNTGRFVQEIKVGLHSFVSGDTVFVMDWRRDVVRPYILNNTILENDSVVREKDGTENVVHYRLKMKRQVDLFFDKVDRVIQHYPVKEESRDVVADEFLKDLLRRRSGTEFRNIVFSIQQKQGEIIQAPFHQNMIVQGCAGSGKSMIMLHRLPIVLFDNPNSLDRNNLYIITPSQAYIQMANNMRAELEIEDLKMGTLEQYYNHVLNRYDINTSVYGRIRPDLQLTPEQTDYIYSPQFAADIAGAMENAIARGRVDLSKAARLFGTRKNYEQRTTVNEKILEEILKIQYYRSLNEEALRKYHAILSKVVEALEDLSKTMKSREPNTVQELEAEINSANRIVEKLREAGKRLKGRDAMYKRAALVDEIIEVQKTIQNYKDKLAAIKKGDSSLDTYADRPQLFDWLHDLLIGYNSDMSKMTIADIYRCLANREKLFEKGTRDLEKLTADITNSKKYTSSMGSGIKRAQRALEELAYFETAYLPADIAAELETAFEYYNKLQKTLVHGLYLNTMKGLGHAPNKAGRLDALRCSPYIYLQIVYQFRGIHFQTKESLITIDEAQNIAPEELRLIKAVNNNRVVLNLFGDVGQHAEHTKGVNSWQRFKDIADFKISELNENYRNARQITNYCNQTFNMKMKAINLDGAGVHIYEAEEEFVRGLHQIFTRPMKTGLSAVIVKNAAEAAWIRRQAYGYTKRINDVTAEPKELLHFRWNLLTVSQVNGLEFETVIAVSGRMEQNEKYIAYTRALDELHICTAPPDISPTRSAAPIRSSEEELTKPHAPVRRKRKKR